MSDMPPDSVRPQARKIDWAADIAELIMASGQLPALKGRTYDCTVRAASNLKKHLASRAVPHMSQGQFCTLFHRAKAAFAHDQLQKTGAGTPPDPPCSVVSARVFLERYRAVSSFPDYEKKFQKRCVTGNAMAPPAHSPVVPAQRDLCRACGQLSRGRDKTCCGCLDRQFVDAE